MLFSVFSSANVQNKCATMKFNHSYSELWGLKFLRSCWQFTVPCGLYTFWLLFYQTFENSGVKPSNTYYCYIFLGPGSPVNACVKSFLISNFSKVSVVWVNMKETLRAQVPNYECQKRKRGLEEPSLSRSRIKAPETAGISPETSSHTS